MSDSKVEVLQVPEGSILWLHNIGGPGHRHQAPYSSQFN